MFLILLNSSQVINTKLKVPWTKQKIKVRTKIEGFFWNQELENTGSNHHRYSEKQEMFHEVKKKHSQLFHYIVPRTTPCIEHLSNFGTK
jgi:hypothetical protein